MARKRFSDLARPEPLEFEAEDGSILFTMPRRLLHLSPPERREFERLYTLQRRKAVELSDFVTDAVEKKALDSETYAPGRDAIYAVMREASWGICRLAVPDMSREFFDGTSEFAIAELIQEFSTSPFDKPTEDPATSDSAAT